MSEHSAEKNALPMRAWSEPNPDCLLVKRDEAHGAHDLASPGGAKPGSGCGGIASINVPPPGGSYRPCAGCDSVGESCRAVGCPATRSQGHA